MRPVASKTAAQKLTKPVRPPLPRQPGVLYRARVAQVMPFPGERMTSLCRSAVLLVPNRPPTRPYDAMVEICAHCASEGIPGKPFQKNGFRILLGFCLHREILTRRMRL